jgi:hypothetical protein
VISDTNPGSSALQRLKDGGVFWERWMSALDEVDGYGRLMD